MAKIIAFRDDGWMPPNTDFRMWDALARAFGHDLQMIDSWSEASVPSGNSVIVVDEGGANNLSLYTHPTDVAYVFGRTSQDLISTVPHDDSISISTPNAISLFGVSAASIICRHREQQLVG